MKIIYFFFLIVIFSCSSEKGLNVVKYKVSRFSKSTYKILLPKGFKATEIDGGNEWREVSFKYENNSVFYISNERGKPTIYFSNSENDEKINQKFIDAFFSNDTITIQGIDINGKYWKNKYNKEVNFGYINVSKEQKVEFDKIISTIIKK